MAYSWNCRLNGIGDYMTKPYLIYVNNVLAQRKLTYQGARKVKDELEKKGYQKISIAYDTGNHYA